MMRVGVRACHMAAGSGEGALHGRDTMNLKLTGL